MFITVKFSPADARSYTYRWADDAAPEVGQIVSVENKDGAKLVTVDAVDVPEPSFACKVAMFAPETDAKTPTDDPAPIGHNSGPVFPPDSIDAICGAYEDARQEAESWLDGSPVENEAQMLAADKLRGEMRAWRLELEKGQKAATAPLYDAYKAEGDRWKPTIEDAKRIEAGIVALVDGFKRKLAAQKDAERRAAFEAADKARREAEEAARQVNPADIEEARAAAEAQARAAQATRDAQAAAKDTVKGLRTVTRYEVTDHRDALHWIAKNDRDAMTAFVDEYVRRNHAAKPIAGVRVWQEKEAF